MSVHPYVHPHIPPETGVSQKLAQASHGWMDMGRNEHTNVQIPLFSTELCSLWSSSGRCSAQTIATLPKYHSRARVPLTISCLWATGYNQESGSKCWATCSFFCSFTAHTFPCFALLALLVRFTALTRLLANSLTPKDCRRVKFSRCYQAVLHHR